VHKLDNKVSAIKICLIFLVMNHVADARISSLSFHFMQAAPKETVGMCQRETKLDGIT
jgi:hypothetical protein